MSGPGALLRRSLGLAAVAIAACGCMALPSSRMLFEDPPLDVKATVPLRAALVTLRDNRPATDREQLSGVGQLPEQLTAVLLSDFSEARLFSSIALATDTRDADVLLRGEFRQLTWKPRHNPWPYVPALAFLAEIGVPVARTVSAVEIALEVANPASDQVIAAYTGSGSEQRAYTLYTPQYRPAGDGPFRHASQQLQDAILGDRDRLVAAVKTAAPAR